MSSVKKITIPQHALLQTYANQQGSYVDCFYTDVPKHVSLEAFIFAFFTTSAFRLERKLLGLFASRPSTTKDVNNLANGTTDFLAFWKVEVRDENQLLMVVADGPIHSWLMVELSAENQNQTHLYFGSAVLPEIEKKTGTRKMNFLFSLLLGFHKEYSKILLWLARRSLLSST